MLLLLVIAPELGSLSSHYMSLSLRKKNYFLILRVLFFKLLHHAVRFLVHATGVLHL